MNDSILNYQEIGRRITVRRLELLMTRKDLAKRMDVTPAYIGGVEKGERKPALEMVARLCAALDLSTDYLLYGRKYLCDRTKCKLINDLEELISGNRNGWT